MKRRSSSDDRLVHESADGESRILATDVEFADSIFAKLRGLMFRRSIPADYALLFAFDDVASRSVHMLFVPFAIDVLWVEGATVTRVESLAPWTGLAVDTADEIVELPAGAAAAVDVGDTVRLGEFA